VVIDVGSAGSGKDVLGIGVVGAITTSQQGDEQIAGTR
jgi:hypothetical protein